MTVLGLVFSIGGYITILAGMLLNIDPITVGVNYLSGGSGMPGTIYVMIGTAALIIGVISLAVTARKNEKSKQRRKNVMISGIVSVIVLGVIFISGGLITTFLGIQVNNAFSNAWDLITSYFSFGPYGTFGSNISTVFLVIGIFMTLIGITMVTLGVLEAVKFRSRISGRLGKFTKK